MNYLEMLARLGAGSAHPGGFSATLDQLNHFPIPVGSRVLEVGCGTGRTACYLAKQGCEVTALDIRSDMLEKAKKRAKEEQVKVSFVEGDACALPFKDNQFDVILVESVSNFAGIEQSLCEYYRVLRSGGVLYDREMLAPANISKELREAIRDFYGIPKLLTPKKWNAELSTAKFMDAKIWKPSKLPEDMWKEELKYPDHLQMSDEDAFQNPELIKVVKRYDDIMIQYADQFRFGVMIGTKG